MQTSLDLLPYAMAAQVPNIFRMLPSALSQVPFHHDTPAVLRFFAEKFPIHVGVHQVSAGQEPPLEYTQPHVHEDWNEVNIIVSPEELVYKIQLGDNEYTVRNNACIWIPKGTIHSANVVRGTGYYIAFRLE